MQNQSQESINGSYDAICGDLDIADKVHLK